MSRNLPKEAREGLIKLQMFRASVLYFSQDYSLDYEKIKLIVNCLGKLASDYFNEVPIRKEFFLYCGLQSKDEYFPDHKPPLPQTGVIADFLKEYLPEFKRKKAEFNVMLFETMFMFDLSVFGYDRIPEYILNIDYEMLKKDKKRYKGISVLCALLKETVFKFMKRYMVKHIYPPSFLGYIQNQRFIDVVKKRLNIDGIYFKSFFEDYSDIIKVISVDEVASLLTGQPIERLKSGSNSLHIAIKRNHGIQAGELASIIRDIVDIARLKSEKSQNFRKKPECPSFKSIETIEIQDSGPDGELVIKINLKEIKNIYDFERSLIRILSTECCKNARSSIDYKFEIIDVWKAFLKTRETDSSRPNYSKIACVLKMSPDKVKRRMIDARKLFLSAKKKNYKLPLIVEPKEENIRNYIAKYYCPKCKEKYCLYDKDNYKLNDRSIPDFSNAKKNFSYCEIYPDAEIEYFNYINQEKAIKAVDIPPELDFDVFLNRECDKSSCDTEPVIPPDLIAAIFKKSFIKCAGCLNKPSKDMIALCPCQSIIEEFDYDDELKKYHYMLFRDFSDQIFKKFKN